MTSDAKGRTRRQHSPELKHQVVDECRQPGASVAGVALAHGLNANLVRRWMAEQGVEPPSRRPLPEPDLGFVPIRLEPVSPPPPQDIRIELRRGRAIVTITWPLAAAGECGAWLQKWLG
jgi:transposase